MIFIPGIAKKDWVLVLLGVIAGVGYFWFMSFTHPLRIADASLESDHAKSISIKKLNDMGFSDTGSYSHTIFKVRSNLLDTLQKKIPLEEFRESDRYNLFSPFYWSTRIESIKPGSRFLTARDEENEETVVTLEIQLNEKGEWLTLRNELKLIPDRLLNPNAFRRAVNISDQTISDLHADSLLTNRIQFNFRSDLPRSEELNSEKLQQRSHFLNNEQAASMAGYYLQESAWPGDEFDLKSVRRQIYPGFDAAEVTFLHHNTQLDYHIDLVVHVAPTGALLHMMPEYSPQRRSALSYNQFITSGRVILGLIFFIWILAQLYIRMKLRVVDTKSTILVSGFAGILILIFHLMGWLYSTTHTLQGPGLHGFFIQLLSAVFLAVFSSTGLYIITAVGDSLTRQNWIEKIRCVDLLKLGQIFNKHVGISYIRSVCFAFIFGFIFSLLIWILPGSYLSLNNTFESNATYLAPVVEILVLLFTSYVVVQTVFMIIVGRLSIYTKNTVIVGVTGGLLFGISGPLYFGFGPLGYEFLLTFLIGFGFGVLFAKTEALTTFFSLFLFILIIITTDGWVLSQSPDAAIFYNSLLVISLFLVLGSIGLYKGKSIRELPKYIPGYVDELVQLERTKQELEIARGIQESFLPERTPTVQKVDLAGICIPAYETGGDYYDFISMNDDMVAIAIGDVSGKGVQATFYMTFVKGIVHAFCKDSQSSTPLLTRVNDLFLQNSPKGTFISLIYGVLNSCTGEFVFSRAGHNPLFHFHAKSKTVEQIRPDGIGIGMTDTDTFIKKMKESRLQLEKDDILVLFTDGVVEAVDRQGNQYGDKNLMKTIEACENHSSKEIMYDIINNVKTFSGGAEQHDDMTLVVIKME